MSFTQQELPEDLLRRLPILQLGGEQQLGSQIENNDIDMVIFLRDPLHPKNHEPDINNIFTLCDTHNIPLATNLATAELLILALDRGDLDWREFYK